jgi:endo-1,3-1,4-beta-glycanase ExoK
LADTAAPRSVVWQGLDAEADRFVLAAWIGLGALVLLAAILLRPAQIETGRPILPLAAGFEQGVPQFFPYVRPGTAPRETAGIVSWMPPERPRNGGFLTRLASPTQDPVFRASDHGNANSFYGGDWKPQNITRRNGGLHLEVKRERSGGLPYTAAEMYSSTTFSHGRYEVIMQPARGSGLVTAFFTYTGPWFDDPHDEVDIEFLGSDTTKIHFNYFRKGRSIKPATFDLPFDAASAPRLYAFEWRPDGITWFVEDEPIYATVAGDGGIPVAKGKVMFSAWTGKPRMEGWHGPPLFRDGAGAEFYCVSFTPLGHDTPKCGDNYSPRRDGRLTSGG